jgi:hypothetical protein
MKDFSEVTDLETARKILIGYDEAFMKGAAEIERLKAALEEARVIAKTGWLTANCSVIGDADYAAELCEYIADQIAAL